MQTERFTLFYVGPLSQWHRCEFTINGQAFNTAEQFMMYGKAMLFGDLEIAEKILRSKTPHDQKNYGRQVRGFDEQRWTLFREGLVFAGNYAKFKQNPPLLQYLLDTQGTTLVEASPVDNIWGIGLGEGDPRALQRSQWQGLNLLGKVLTQVREALIYESRYES